MRLFDIFKKKKNQSEPKRIIDAEAIGLDPLFEDAARLFIKRNNASTSLLQRQYEIGYNRANRIMDQLELASIVGPNRGYKPRVVLVDLPTLEVILKK